MVNREVVEQHGEDAAFLWFSRERAVGAPHYRLKDIVRLDERVEANLDGLRVAGATGWDLAIKAMEKEGAGEAFAAAVLAFETKDRNHIDSILKIGTNAPALVRAVVSALGWIRFEDARPSLDALLLSERAELRDIAVAGYAVHRVDPGDVLWQMAADVDPVLQGRAFKTAGELGRADLAHTIVRSISSTDKSCRFYAAWSAARLGLRDRDVLDTLRAIADAGGPHSDGAMQIVLRCLRPDEARNWLSNMLGSPRHLRFGVIGLGVVGDPAGVSELIGYMQVEQVARVAGEAFSMITGADLKYLDLDGSTPENFEAGPNDDPNDPNVAMDADEDLPWPSPDLVRKWWDKQQHEYQTGVRYLCGKPVGPANLIGVLKDGYQRQRAAAALELALLRPSDPMFEVRAPGRRQAEMLAAWTS